MRRMPPVQLKLKVHSLRAFSKTANVKSPATTTSFTPTSRTRSGSVGPMDSRRFGMSTACGGCGRSSVATCGCSGAGYVVQPLRWSVPRLALTQLNAGLRAFHHNATLIPCHVFSKSRRQYQLGYHSEESLQARDHTGLHLKAWQIWTKCLRNRLSNALDGGVFCDLRGD